MTSIIPLENAADYREWLGYTLPATGAAGRARAAALTDLCRRPPAPAEAVAYRSQGRLLIIGPEPAAREVNRDLGDRLRCTLLLTWWAPDSAPTGAARPADGIEVIRADLQDVAGHLGAFFVTVREGDGTRVLGESATGEPRRFDLVLDLQREPALARDIPPPGYFAPRGDARKLAEALEELPELVGEFQKPRYFSYDPAICAHGNSGLTGCTRCLDVCPTIAIRSLGEKIEVDPYLCQGAGSCSAVCPTGAIGYAVPPAGELRERLRRLLHRFSELAPDTAPALLFHDGEGGREQAAGAAAKLPEWIIPWPVEEIGSVGLDVWIAALAHGARAIVVLASPATPPSVLRAVQEQQTTAMAILTALGYDASRIRVVVGANDTDLASLAALPDAHWAPARFSAADEKRTTLRLALEHLYSQASQPASVVALDRGAPFGNVTVNGAACTLCMSCAGLCPTAALLCGDGTPTLRFVEWNCIQCGLCRGGCPENAIELTPRLVLDPEQRGTVRTLHEDTPFECVVCGKPFATRAVMTRMAEKLGGHWMFQTAEAKRRLQMCEDCRVRDLLERESGHGSGRSRQHRGH